MNLGKLKELLRYDDVTGKLYWKSTTSNRVSAGDEAGYESQGYRRVTVLGKRVMAHKLVWFLVTDEWPDFELDHIDLDRSNNKFSNLRKASRSENFFNKTKYATNTSGYKGVTKRKNKWIAQIAANGKHHYLGIFDTVEEAAIAYAEGSKNFHGEYGRIN